MVKYRGKYRNNTTRLQSWDYANPGVYFVTFCTKDRVCFFGEVVQGTMLLNEVGAIAHACWMQIPHQFEFVELGEWVVMPNHVHGVIRIKQKVVEAGLEEPHLNEGARFILPPRQGGITGHKNPMLHQNLSTIIRWYKARTTFLVHGIEPDFSWQSRFHDRILWNALALHRVSAYIRNNPKNWNETKD